VNDGTGTGSISRTIQLNNLMRNDTEDFSISQKTEISCKDTVFLPHSSDTSDMSKDVKTTHKCVNCMIAY